MCWIRKVLFLFFMCIGIMTIFSVNLNSQIRRTGTENSDDICIITTTKIGSNFVPTQTIEYFYKGRKYTLGMWASDFYNIVKDFPYAVEEVSKYRKKIVVGSILGYTFLGFAIPPISQKLDGRKVNYLFVGIAIISGITASIILNSRNENIIRAADYYNQNFKKSSFYERIDFEPKDFNVSTPIQLTYNIKF